MSPSRLTGHALRQGGGNWPIRAMAVPLAGQTHTPGEEYDALRGWWCDGSGHGGQARPHLLLLSATQSWTVSAKRSRAVPRTLPGGCRARSAWDPPRMVEMSTSGEPPAEISIASASSPRVTATSCRTRSTAATNSASSAALTRAMLFATELSAPNQRCRVRSRCTRSWHCPRTGGLGYGYPEH
jgi:hypothetical protein